MIDVQDELSWTTPLLPVLTSYRNVGSTILAMGLKYGEQHYRHHMTRVLTLLLFITSVLLPACTPEYDTINGCEIRPNTTCISFELNGADMRGADLRGANLSGTSLNRADLRSANLSGAHLYEANMRNASLHSANLTNADLRQADLSGGLIGADLRGASLNRADLRGANLSGALYDKDTVFSISTPKGFDPEAAGMVLME